jgi:holo-[acyl-carrier protein] synthase
VTPISGVGVDAVDVARFGAALDRHPRIAARLFTDGERADGAGDVQRLAVRFAAKEAAMKALGRGLGAFGWHDVEVVHLDGGAPSLRVCSGAASIATARGVSRWHVSLTHTATVAVAMVVAEE